MTSAADPTQRSQRQTIDGEDCGLRGCRREIAELMAQHQDLELLGALAAPD